jgi:hypothetical protein
MSGQKIQIWEKSDETGVVEWVAKNSSRPRSELPSTGTITAKR